MFNVTLARTYRWQTEDEREQTNFVVSLIKLFRSVTRGAPLQIAGIRDPDAAPCTSLSYSKSMALKSNDMLNSETTGTSSTGFFTYGTCPDSP